MYHLTYSIPFSSSSSSLFYEMLDVLFDGSICREGKFDGCEEGRDVFFCSINEIFSIRMNADSFSVFI
jgi:hypothetical protein